MFLLWPTILLVFYGLPYYFSTVLRAACASGYHHASVYTAHYECTAQICSHLSFFRLTDTRNEVGHETWSSWSSDKNFFAKLSKGCFPRSYTWFVYIQFLITISSPWNPWSKISTIGYQWSMVVNLKWRMVDVDWKSLSLLTTIPTPSFDPFIIRPFVERVLQANMLISLCAVIPYI